MKKIHFLSLSIFLSLTISLFGLIGLGYLAEDENEPLSCEEAYTGAIVAAEADWKINLSRLRDQEKPVSKMVDEAYENLRTYDCWLEYICRSVQYSGISPIESVFGTGLTSKQLGVVPGCQKPENMRMEGKYNEFVETMKKVPIAGIAIQAKENYFINNQLAYFPSCQTSPQDNAVPNIIVANDNFLKCKGAVELQFGCDENSSPEELQECMTESSAFAYMENQLVTAHAEQKTSALEGKLSEIVTKLYSMEERVTYVSNFLSQLNDRLVCIAQNCL